MAKKQRPLSANLEVPIWKINLKLKVQWIPINKHLRINFCRSYLKRRYSRIVCVGMTIQSMRRTRIEAPRSSAARLAQDSLNWLETSQDQHMSNRTNTTNELQNCGYIYLSILVCKRRVSDILGVYFPYW